MNLSCGEAIHGHTACGGGYGKWVMGKGEIPVHLGWAGTWPARMAKAMKSLKRGEIGNRLMFPILEMKYTNRTIAPEGHLKQLYPCRNCLNSTKRRVQSINDVRVKTLSAPLSALALGLDLAWWSRLEAKTQVGITRLRCWPLGGAQRRVAVIGSAAHCRPISCVGKRAKTHSVPCRYTRSLSLLLSCYQHHFSFALLEFLVRDGKVPRPEGEEDDDQEAEPLSLVRPRTTLAAPSVVVAALGHHT